MQHISNEHNRHNEHIHYLSAGRWQHHCWHRTNWRRWRCARGCQSEPSSDRDSVNRCTAAHRRPPSPADSAAGSTTETAGSVLYTHVKQRRSCIQSLTTSMAITPITRHRASTSTRWRFTFALCCHSNETSALMANLPNSAQLEGTLYHSPKLHPGPCSSAKMRQGTDTHTHTHTHTHTDSHDNYTLIIIIIIWFVKRQNVKRLPWR